MKRFTLIELLVVIAIIAILLSILLPSMKNARIKARVAVEISNRKQLLNGTIMYANANDGFLPPKGDNTVAVEYLHSLKKFGSKENINISLVEKYLGKDPKIRETLMFCDSTLMEVRNPKTPKYTNDHSSTDSNFCTLNYYLIPKTGLLHDSDFKNYSIQVAEPSNPVWSCMILQVNSVWMGHDAPKTTSMPAGASTAFMDGSAKWCPTSTFQALWTNAAGYKSYMGTQ